MLEGFASIDDAQSKIEAWRKDYDWKRPHSSSGNRTPRAFVQSWEPPEPIPLIAMGLKSQPFPRHIFQAGN